MSSSSLFLFDFDGILIDSKKELALTAFNAASRMDPPKVRLEDLPPGFLEKFFALYHLPRNGGEICGLGEWLLQDDQAREYDAFLADLRNVPEDVTQKEREFFAARKLLMTKDEPAWCELNSPIQPLWDRKSSNRKPHSNRHASYHRRTQLFYGKQREEIGEKYYLWKHSQ